MAKAESPIDKTSATKKLTLGYNETASNADVCNKYKKITYLLCEWKQTALTSKECEEQTHDTRNEDNVNKSNSTAVGLLEVEANPMSTRATQRRQGCWKSSQIQYQQEQLNGGRAVGSRGKSAANIRCMLILQQTRNKKMFDLEKEG